MKKRNVIEVPEVWEEGKFANAFRVVSDGDEHLLDWMVYSPGDRTAQVVARVRMHEGMIAAVRNQLSLFLTELVRADVDVEGDEKAPVFIFKGNDEVH